MKKFVSLLFISLTFYIGNSQTITGPTSYCQGASTTLTVTGAPGGSTFQWTLNTVNITNATNISLTVTTSGTYNVIVTVAGNSTTLADIVITAFPPSTASFTFNPNNACAKSNVQFTNSSTGTGLTYLWNFNDPGSGANNTSTLINPTHSFIGSIGNGTQNFNVKLITTSVNGCQDSTTSTVTIKQRPDPQLGGTGASIYNSLPYFKVCSSSPASNFIFTNLSTTTSTNTNYTFVWGDNTPNLSQSSFTSTTHTYPRTRL